MPIQPRLSLSIGSLFVSIRAHELANEGAFTPRLPPVFHLGLVKPGFEPTTIPLGDVPPRDVSVFAARP